ncbi:MAG: class I SAM-dependent methyltransferase [Bryobacterales bacterium]|nr:class I SAM-dependent methyltransferase [Bryobacterales bacterium]
MINRVSFVCPACLGQVEQTATETECLYCGSRFRRNASGCTDFAPEASFDDHWTRNPEVRKAWLAIEAPREEEYELGLAKRYVLPLLEKLGYRPGSTTVLSAGCGMASEVDLLNGGGYEGWGIDIGNRVDCWERRTSLNRLARADIRKMPFPDECFDFVLSLNTIEHIGVVGDTDQVTPDYAEERRRAMHSLLRVTKPGGHVLLSGLTRNIPFDFGHVQDHGFVRIHSPWEPFLLNFSDIRKLCAETGKVEWAKPLPLRGFFSWTRLRHSPARPLLPVVDWLFGELPHFVYGWWACPFWIALVRKRPAEAVQSTAAA